MAAEETGIPGVYKVIPDYEVSPMESREAVRKRPGMYIGDTGVRGLHNLFKEIIKNSVDEAMAGYCTKIDVIYGIDSSLTVADNGRGIPIGIDEQTGKNVVELVFTDLHVRFNRDRHGKISGGLHGAGVCVVNMLSEWLECEVRCDGKIHRQRFEHSIPTSPLAIVGECDKDEHGTKITWLADDTIFGRALDEDGGLYYGPDILRNRIRELAYLHKNLSISFHDACRGNTPEIYHYLQGIASYIAERNRGKELVHPQVLYFEYISGETNVEIAMQYTADEQGAITSFAKDIYTCEGGTHVTGFETALKRTLNRYARKNGFLSEEDKNFSTQDVRAGLTAIISARMPNVSFGGSSTDRLSTPEVATVINRSLGKDIARFLKANPNSAHAILERVSQSAQKRRQ